MAVNYFSTSARRTWLQRSFSVLSEAMTHKMPRLSVALGKQLLLRPRGVKKQTFEVIKPNQSRELQLLQGKVKVHFFGEGGGDWIITSHGWADSSKCFEQLIVVLVAKGYRVAALDHLGHGHSSGRFSNILAFRQGLEFCIQHLASKQQKIHGIVGHSMGALSAILLNHDLLINKRLVFVSTPLQMFELMFQKLEHIGIVRKMAESVLHEVASKYQLKWQDLHISHHQHKLDNNALFIHDVNDRLAPFNDVHLMTQNKQIPLFSTQELGHRRILGDTAVIDNILSHLCPNE